MAVNTILLSDFNDLRFRTAFQAYFDELDISVKDWDGLFQEMNNEGNNLAYLMLDRSGGMIGFLQFQMTSFSNWFFEEPLGFVREFWISPAYRRRGYGRNLLCLAERYFIEHGAHRSILTADNAAAFYRANGYSVAPGISARNHMDVWNKNLSISSDTIISEIRAQNIKIREVSADDAGFLFQLMNDPAILKALNEVPTKIGDWIEAIHVWEKDKDEAGYIIENGAVPIGWFALNGLLANNHKAFLKMAVLQPAYQGKHIGRYVLEHILEQLRSQGYVSVALFTNQDNLTAQRCYAACGFEIVDTLTDQMSDQSFVKRYQMERRL